MEGYFTFKLCKNVLGCVLKVVNHQMKRAYQRERTILHSKRALRQQHMIGKEKLQLFKN